MLRLTLLILLVGGCTPVRDLDELVQRDSAYLEPRTLEPYSGRVFRLFRDDSTKVELEGTLREGVWHGGLTVFHQNGRIRYTGAHTNGAQCGPWTENADPEPRESLYEEFVLEIESLSVDPPCPAGVSK